MRRFLTASAAALALAAGGVFAQSADPLAPIGVGQRPPPPPIRPVTEDLFGVKVTDDYRYFEQLGPETLDWMKAQGAYTRSVLDAIRPLPELQKRVSAFTGSFGFINSYATFGGRAFYDERAPGSDNFDLMVRQPDGSEHKLVDVAALRASHGGVPFAINYIQPSPDGSKVAVGISQGGSENADLFVYDAASGRQIAGPIDRARFGVSSWTNDSRALFVLRQKKLEPGEPQTDFERYVAVQLWDLSGPPVTLAGAGTGHGPEISPDEFAFIGVTPGSPFAFLAAKNGVQNEIRAWITPVAEATSPDAHWTPVVTLADGVTSADVRGDAMFLLSHKDAPTFQVLELHAGQPISAARVLVPTDPHRIIEEVHAAADALYVLATDGVYSHLLRVPAGSDRVEDIPLPARGHISSVFTDPRVAGVTLELSSWTLQPTTYRFEPGRGFVDLHLGVRGAMDASAFEIRDLQAPARDGVKVPLSLVMPKGAQGPIPVVIEAYGSYGISELADFSPRRAVMMREGIGYGVCHVRGGGELGEAWRLGGKDAQKPNTWRDVIACGEHLIAQGVTTKDKLFILGGSAGGITMGRAMEERPDLFAGVIDLVPAANTLRAEFSPNGPPNVPEFGTIAKAEGFHNLYEMDSVAHVKRGVAYPPVMIATGLNDPRVSPWEPAKFAAALEASGDPNPVLLRIDQQAGHGIGSTRTQGDLMNADEIAFVFWRSGRPGWRPDAAK
ncbi:MAG TPA: prolyl oligopeptidase family serine peptidase [Caulobacteraceae bacterium]|jgi:prolyl oligopeptidase|nr:prolyl oligopeptidase family serine peptidase [Caulobacteraceae bacterium]